MGISTKVGCRDKYWLRVKLMALRLTEVNQKQRGRWEMRANWWEKAPVPRLRDTLAHKGVSHSSSKRFHLLFYTRGE